MSKFIIENDFLEIFPNVKIGIITCYGIDNSINEENKYVELISEAQKSALSFLSNDVLSENDVVKVWREAFTKFKTKKGARSSIEALLKRSKSGNTLGTINPLVDIYNSISLKYAFPCGGEDIDTFVGNVKLTLASGDEEFITYGSDKSEPPLVGEVVYKDNAGAICRCWNWRESVRTMLTPETKNAFLCIELVDLSREDEFNCALKELKDLVVEELGGSATINILDNNNRHLDL